MSLDKHLSQLRKLFEECHIHNVVIIDDAYFDAPPLEWFNPRRLTELRENINGWEKPSAEFQDLKLEVKDDDDLSEAVVQKLYALRNTSKEIAKWFRDFDAELAEKKNQLAALQKMLLEDLNCNVDTLSPISKIDSGKAPQIVFLDYYLDPQSRAEDSLKLAEEVGVRLAQALSGVDKPIVVLMSSREVSDVMKSQFRDKADLLGGLFYFIPKSEITKSSALLIKLAILIRSLEDARRIQGFVESFERELNGASNKFVKKIKSLSLEDYAYMQKLSLQGEGMPLGDYLLWLFGTYFGFLLFRSIPTERRQLDAMTFTSIPEAENSPSSEFSDLYKNVVAGEVEELSTHPRATGEGEASTAPDAHFGDIFIDDTRKVRMIATAECDLLFAPEVDSKRPFEPDRSIFLVPGSLCDMNSGDGDNRTGFFPHGEKVLAIEWQVDRVKTHKWGELRSDLAASNFKRTARLRAPFSTQVQDAFTRNVSRIGVPVAPPLLKTVEISLHWRNDARVTQRCDVSVGAVLFKDREKGESVQLKLPAIVEVVRTADVILQSCRARLQQLQQERGEDPETNEEKKMTSQISQLERLSGDLESSYVLRRPYAVKSGPYVIPKMPVCICRNEAQIEANLDRGPIVLLISAEAVDVEIQTTSVEDQNAQPAVNPIEDGPAQ